ncbi:MarR family winged helix-turn-helix transcriptional regulator [Corynebacterium urinipleomorphum]|uniref:MarR family winged helix-turn-helix transcriptional regulator n=1 Tax=Corynebacterium urinipleomorphum TaxID=1852380 RepID=UPI001F41DC39|nr:MarR family transcriptional regulator [Corynebacterium urinipleomorphum]
MENTDSLSDFEADTWARMWACHMQLPCVLDAQLKRDSGVSYFEFQVMLKIGESPTASRRMTDLSEATAMSLSHLSRVVTRLEKKGFVARIPDPNDGRSTFAALTPSGQRALASGMSGYLTELRRIFFDNVDESELETVASVLARMNSALSGAEASGSAAQGSAVSTSGAA